MEDALSYYPVSRLHTRLPSNHSSSFHDGSRLINKSLFTDPYNLGVAQLIVRQYPDAKASFSLALDEGIVKKQGKMKFENNNRYKKENVKDKNLKEAEDCVVIVVEEDDFN